MNQNKIKTAEFVSPMHPDKQCDIIADTLLDAFLAGDEKGGSSGKTAGAPKSRCAIEVMGGHGQITISGEVTSATKVDISKVVKNIVGEQFNVNVYLVKQSPEIAQGVDTGGAGDQGIMMGYATSETKNFMSLEYELARDLCRKIFERWPNDGKTQVTVERPEGGGEPKIRTVVASFQNSKTLELEKFVRATIKANEYLVNPAGEWNTGGFDADSGLSGRKIVIDNYGPEVGVGGGSFSGKDYTKVDRSGAYMARRIAVDLLTRHAAKAVRVKLAYAIGKHDPVMAVAEVHSADGSRREIAVEGYDLTPAGIHRFLELDKVKWAETAAWGHFGRGWEWR